MVFGFKINGIVNIWNSKNRFLDFKIWESKIRIFRISFSNRVDTRWHIFLFLLPQAKVRQPCRPVRPACPTVQSRYCAWWSWAGRSPGPTISWDNRRVIVIAYLLFDNYYIILLKHALIIIKLYYYNTAREK